MFSPVFISRFAKFAINATGQQPVLGAIISSFCRKYTKNNDKCSHFVIIFLHYFLPPGISRPFLCRYYSYPIPANPTEVPLLLLLQGQPVQLYGGIVRRFSRNQIWGFEKHDPTMASFPSFPSSLIFIIKVKYENQQRSQHKHQAEDKPVSP